MQGYHVWLLRQIPARWQILLITSRATWEKSFGLCKKFITSWRVSIKLKSSIYLDPIMQLLTFKTKLALERCKNVVSMGNGWVYTLLNWCTYLLRWVSRMFNFPLKKKKENKKWFCRWVENGRKIRIAERILPFPFQIQL